MDSAGGRRSGVDADELQTTNVLLRSNIDGAADPVDAKDAAGRIPLP